MSCMGASTRRKEAKGRRSHMDFYEHRSAPIEMLPDEFRALGHQLINDLADFLATLPDLALLDRRSPSELRALLGDEHLPERGRDAAELLTESFALLADNQVFNSHPGFLSYITAAAAPIGILGDLMASMLNPNLALHYCGALATEIELQTIDWIAEFLGYPIQSGVMSSGGQMANQIAFIAARAAKAPWAARIEGSVSADHGRLKVYATSESHNWLKMAADLFGIGNSAIVPIVTNTDQTMRLDALENAIEQDLAEGDIPFLVVAAAGTVNTGAIDPLPQIAELCRRYDCWFHVDGAYGAPAVGLEEPPEALLGLRLADSVAVDPHKWFYMPIDIGCTLFRDPSALTRAFSATGAKPTYYEAEAGKPTEEVINLYEFGPENSRRFRSLKLWLALQQVGRKGYQQMISDDIALAEELDRLVRLTPELEVGSLGLSISTFRYVPSDLASDSETAIAYLNKLNQDILKRIRHDGVIAPSNAMINGNFYIRCCIVNFRTDRATISLIPGLVLAAGRAADLSLRGDVKPSLLA